jgi:hypothetical protein
MSTNQSNLSSPQFGYDFVVAVTQAAINSTMREFVNETEMPLITAYYNQDPATGAAVEVDLPTLLTQTNGTDPLKVPGWSSPSPMTSDIKNLSASNFYFAFQAKIGIPPGFPLTDLPDMVTLEAGSQSVNFSLLCAEFTVVVCTFGRTGLISYVNESQPSGAAWTFTSNVPLKNIIDNSNLPLDVQQKLDNLGADAFSVQQLLFDLDNAILESVPAISGIDSSNPAYIPLTQVFLDTYFTSLKASKQPVLGYSIVPKTTEPDPSPLSLTSLNFEVSPYSPPTQLPDQPDLNTLNYLCAANNDKLPAPVPFNWNWIDQPQAGQYDGTIAVNRNTLAKYFQQQLQYVAMRQCYSTWVRVWLTDVTDCHYQWRMTPGQTPTVIYPATGDTVLHYTWNYPQYYDSAGLGGDMGSMGLASNYDLSVSFAGNTITIVQHLVVNLYISADSDGHGGNVIDKIITDTYTISVNQKGGLTVSAPVSSSQDNSQPPSTNGFFNFFNHLNDISADVANWASEYVGTYLTDIPASTIQTFIFPGGNTFTYTDASFSANQDLVSHITYTNPA